MIRMSASPNSSLSSLSCPQKRRRPRYRQHSTNQREDELERKRYRRGERNFESSQCTTVSSMTTSRTSPSLLMDLFPSPAEDSDDNNDDAAAGSPRQLTRKPAYNPLSQLESLATDHNFSPPRRNASSECASIVEGDKEGPPLSQLFDIPVSASHLENGSEIAGMTRNDYVADLVDFDDLDLPLEHCFDLIEQGIPPSQPLHKNKEMKKLQTNFLKKINKKAGRANNNVVMFHCTQCKNRWMDMVPHARVRGNKREYECKRCHEQSENQNLQGCRLMTVENDMNQWPKYDHLFLPELTEVGQMLISRIFNYMRVYQLSGGGISYKGHVLNVEQDLSMLVNQLPLLPHEIPCFIIRRKNATSPNGYRDFKVNRNHIMLWLKILKVNNPFYADINLEAAEERASLLPEDGLIACSIHDMEEEDEDFSDDEEDNNDSQHQSCQNNNANYDPANIENEHLNDFNQSEIRPETGGASGEPDPSLVIEQVTNIPINQQDQQNTTTNTSNEFLDDLPALVDRHAQTLHENFPHARPPMNDPTSVLWPEPGAFVNDFSEVGLCSKAFPTLFPYGKGDPSCKDRSHEVSLDKAGKHFLKYCVNLKEAQEELRKKYGDSKEEEINAIFDSSSNNSPFVYPFVQNNRFVRFIQNTVERHRANDQRTTWISSNSKFSSLSSDEIGDVINTGGEPLKDFLSSMQCYNANINGSPQYLFKKRKLLETLIDQKGMCSMWFTLSMADNHWTDLFAMMTRDSGGKVTEMPTFNSVQEEASWKRKMVRENPHLVDAYFYDRVNTLIEEVFGKNGIEIEWVWYRIEYQSRDAPHVHGCLRFKRDPGILEHSQNVQMGREAARILRAAGLLNESDDFDPST